MSSIFDDIRDGAINHVIQRLRDDQMDLVLMLKYALLVGKIKQPHPPRWTLNLRPGQVLRPINGGPDVPILAVISSVMFDRVYLLDGRQYFAPVEIAANFKEPKL